MTPAPLTGPQLHALARLLATLRPDWQLPGIEAACRRLNADPNLTPDQRIDYALTCARRRQEGTPAGMHTPGPHREPARPETAHMPEIVAVRPSEPVSAPFESRCHHGNRNSLCEACRAESERATARRAAIARGDTPHPGATALAEIRARGRAQLHTAPARPKGRR